MIIFIGLIILGTFFINFAGTGMSGFMNSTSTVLTTSYLSKPNVLSEINENFSGMEKELQNEVDNVKENYSGYDEYIHHNDSKDNKANDMYSADARQFVTFTTKNGKTFHLIINHDEDSEKDCGCMKGKITASTLEDIVGKEMKHYTESFLENEQTRSIEYVVQESICQNLKERKKKLEIEKQKLQVSKMQFYEKHKQGIIDKEVYLSQKETLSKQLQNIEQEISVIENKIKENSVSEHKLNVDKLKDAVSREELDIDWINEVIDRIYVYDKDKVEIIWKFTE